MRQRQVALRRENPPTERGDVTTVAEALTAGACLPHDAIAAFAWPLLIHAAG
jgi:hypothetical protein